MEVKALQHVPVRHWRGRGGEDEEAAGWSDAETRQFLRLTRPTTYTLEFESNLFPADGQKLLVVLFQFELIHRGGSGSSSRTKNGSN